MTRPKRWDEFPQSYFSAIRGVACSIDCPAAYLAEERWIGAAGDNRDLTPRALADTFRCVVREALARNMEEQEPRRLVPRDDEFAGAYLAVRGWAAQDDDAITQQLGLCIAKNRESGCMPPPPMRPEWDQ